MAEHNELGSWEKKMAVGFLRKRRIYYFGTNWTFQKQKLSLPKRKLAIVEVKTRSSLGLVCHKIFVKPKKIQLLLKKQLTPMSMKRAGC
jgi:putative endonuclease